MTLITTLRTNISAICCCERAAGTPSSKKSMGVLNSMPSVAVAKPSISSSSSLKNNPKKITMVVPSDDDNEDDCTVETSSSSFSSSESTGAASEEEQDSQANSSKSRRRRRRRRNKTSFVRFTSGTATDPELTTKQKNKRKISPSSESSSELAAAAAITATDCDTCDSVLWWTKKELNVIQRSCIYAVKSYEYGLPLAMEEEDECLTSLERFSSRNRKQRKLVRSQMYETAKAVQDFETTTSIKAPQDMLSQLLQMYSKPMRLEAIESALKLRTAAITQESPSQSQSQSRTASTKKIDTTSLSDDMDVTMVCARQFLSRTSTSNNTTAVTRSAKPAVISPSTCSKVITVADSVSLPSSLVQMLLRCGQQQQQHQSTPLFAPSLSTTTLLL